MGAPFFERGITRRELLRGAVGVAAGLTLLPFLSACEEAKEEKRLIQKTKEMESIPQDGDVVIAGEEVFYLKTGSDIRFPTCGFMPVIPSSRDMEEKCFISHAMVFKTTR